jgi:hypothetical protein
VHAAGPQVLATVLTIETTLQPSKKKVVHSITIANNRARSGEELDEWRLFDLKANTVTYVNEIARTVRTENVVDLMKKHRAALDAALPSYVPRAQVTSSDETVVIKAGAYMRTMKFAQDPRIPAQLFAIMVASDPSFSPYAPMMKSVDEVLMNTRGFPMTDHAELALDDSKMVVDRNVVKVEQKNVDAGWLEVPKGFAAPAATSPHNALPQKEWRFFWRR